MITSTRYYFAIIAAIIGGSTIALQLRSSEASADRTYVGQESCMAAGCHAGAYHDSSDYKGAAAFRETMHQKIHLRPTPETVIIDKYFEGDSVLRVELGTRYAQKPDQD